MNRKIQGIFITCLLLAGCYAGDVNAQYYTPQSRYYQPEDTAVHKGFDKNKLFVGGNVGLAFGNITYLNLSPDVGYRFSKLLAAGFQINGQYESVRLRDATGTVNQKQQYGLVGVGVFGRVYPIEQIFVHLQPEMNFIFGKTKYDNATSRYREQVPSFLAGVGYSQNIGGSSAFTIMVLYDILQRSDSPYGDKPIFRAGVDLGL